MPSQYEHGPDFQTPNEAEISRLLSENADLRRIDDAMVERALVKWWQIDHISEGGDPEFILLSMRDMRQALEAALKIIPDETIWDRAIERVKICTDGRAFLSELAMTMGVIDVCADENNSVPIEKVMPLMLARAREDRERWHNLKDPWPDETVADWQPIVKCQTDNSTHMMRLDDGTTFVGRWGTSQQRWQRRSGPELVREWDAKGERFIWSNLPEGVYPTHFRPL